MRGGFYVCFGWKVKARAAAPLDRRLFAGSTMIMAWTLNGFRRRGDAESRVPWDEASISVLTRIREAVGGADPRPSVEIEHDLPESEGIRFAPGLLDALFSEPEAGRNISARRLLGALSAAIKRPSSATFAHFYELANEADTISIVDNFLERAAAAGLDREAVAGLARDIAAHAPDVPAVKLAIALLGITGQRCDRELLLMLGRADELTIYAAIALKNLLGEAEEEIWTLAKNAEGWGRIQAVFRLEGTTRADIKDWLLREGHRNSIMPEEVAYFCAVNGDLIALLRSDEVDDDLLDRISELFQALVAGGPAEDIRDLADGSEAAVLYLHKVRASAKLTFARFLAVRALQTLVDDRAGEGLPVVDWPVDAQWQVRTGAADYLRQPQWPALVTERLVAEEEQVFWEACRVGELLEMDVWPARFERQRSGKSDQWYFLMQTDSPDRVEQVLALAREQLDLGKVGSGPSLSLGLGAEFADDSAVDFIVQDLGRFPGFGWDFLRVGLTGRSVRLRNMTLRALAAWGPERWPREVSQLLSAAAAREPDAELRQEMLRLLTKCS